MIECPNDQVMQCQRHLLLIMLWSSTSGTNVEFHIRKIKLFFFLLVFQDSAPSARRSPKGHKTWLGDFTIPNQVRWSNPENSECLKFLGNVDCVLYQILTLKFIFIIFIITHVTNSYVVIHTGKQTLIFLGFMSCHLHIRLGAIRDKSAGIKFSIQPVLELLG